MNECPFDFMSDFDGWWLYMKCRIVDDLSHEYARENVLAHKSGWVLLPGFKHGGWSHPWENIRKNGHGDD
jgi:hypothetical protein